MGGGDSAGVMGVVGGGCLLFTESLGEREYFTK